MRQTYHHPFQENDLRWITFQNKIKKRAQLDVDKGIAGGLSRAPLGG